MTTVAKSTPDKTLVQPTRVRYGVVAFAVALAMVTYLDRVCISKLAPAIMKDLSLTDYQMALVFSAFTMAYAIFEIPTARWADSIGTRRVLTRIVVWWSGFTVATATAFNYYSMLVTRFLFGAGEAGAWPCVASTFSRWIPAKERGTIQGIFFAGAHLSGGLTPFLVVCLTPYLHWRSIFVLFGLVGFVWAAAWYWWYRDDPALHPAVNEAELEEIVSGRAPATPHDASWQYWLRLFGHRNTAPLCLMYIGNAYAFYFCITWLPTYLEKRYGIPQGQIGLLAGLPLMLSVLGDLFGGVATDRLTKKFGLRIGRSGLGGAAYIVAAVAMVGAASVGQYVAAIVLMAIAVTAAMFTLGAAWGTCIEIGGSHAGVVSATMNTAGQLGGIASPIVAIYVKDLFGTWDAPLYVMSGLFLAGSICWLFIDPRKRVFD